MSGNTLKHLRTRAQLALAAYELVQESRAIRSDAAKLKESEHPRATNGQFGSGGRNAVESPGTEHKSDLLDIGKSAIKADSEPATKIKAAGICFICDNKILLLQRAQGGDHPETWNFPGGKVEDDEDFEAAARRETMEETGYNYTGVLTPLTQTSDATVDYVTFLAICDPFTVQLCEESITFSWVPVQDVLGMNPTGPVSQGQVES